MRLILTVSHQRMALRHASLCLSLTKEWLSDAPRYASHTHPGVHPPTHPGVHPPTLVHRVHPTHHGTQGTPYPPWYTEGINPGILASLGMQRGINPGILASWV